MGGASGGGAPRVREVKKARKKLLTSYKIML
jgi:hypothetical protein